MGTRKKSGQAAMEFLMTYGWAMLVVLIVIGALAYFGVFNVQSLLPQRCILPAPFNCPGFKAAVSGSDVVFDVTILNGGIGAVKFNDVIIDDTQLQARLGTCTASPAAVVNPGQQKSFSISCSGKAASFPSGGRVRTQIKLAYSDLQTNYDHTVSGEIIADIEAAP